MASAAGPEALGRKDDELAEYREQIRAQQVAIENLQLDLRDRHVRRSSFGDHHHNESDDTQEEVSVGWCEYV